ncbi:hypothetical protein [Saccharospirillum salsuginis]|uniref:Uncharacterized protein n=1 Tax=Saccharospirillum salsuginis TaxID=418750 RepID=A0A918K8D8_9GAMM|nr:hypothetical protein [Saccharospirillum salsuginis]GGX52264.1 hypothetical protein GCM10007392_19490 [Saccharospirillum salsuginis]
MDRHHTLTDLVEQTAGKINALDDLADEAGKLGAFDVAGKMRLGQQAQVIAQELAGLQLEFMRGVVDALKAQGVADV